MALTKTMAFLAVVCVMAALTMTPAAAQSAQELARCRLMATDVSQCTLKVADPLGPTTAACCSLIRSAQSSQIECLCGVYIGLNTYATGDANPLVVSGQECGITTDFPSTCAKYEKQLQDSGYVTGSGNTNAGSGSRNAGSGTQIGAAGKTATSGVFGILLVAVFTMLF